MIEDQPVHMDRVRTIEATMDEMKSQHKATHQLLQDVLARLGPAQAQNVQDPLPTRPARGSPTPSIPASSAGRKKLALKPSFPPNFSGDRAAGKAFLTSCRTYIRLCPEAFEDDLTKIIWAMSYMKTGRANRWATREFEQEAKAGHLHFINWLDFEEEFQKDFMPLDLESAAINVLEMTAYFQGKRTVDDYLDQFRDLIYNSRYTDPKTVVVKFRQGLRKPGSVSQSGWIKTARQMRHSTSLTDNPTSRLPRRAALWQCPDPSRLHPPHASPTPTRPQATPSRWT